MKTILRTIVLGLGLTVLAGVSAAQEWEKLAPVRGGFSVSMPGKPTEGKQEVPTDAGKIMNHTYVLQSGGVVYMVSSADFPSPVSDPATIRTMLDNARDSMTETAGSQLKDEKEIKLDGNPGREWFVRVPEGLMRARAYWVRKRLYQAIILTPVGKDADAEKAREARMAKFLDSFALSTVDGGP